MYRFTAGYAFVGLGTKPCYLPLQNHSTYFRRCRGVDDRPVTSCNVRLPFKRDIFERHWSQLRTLAVAITDAVIEPTVMGVPQSPAIKLHNLTHRCLIPGQRLLPTRRKV
jgi:hypothetical protein